MDALMEELLEAPDLPRKLQVLNEAFAREQARRERFYEEMTPYQRVEFINGQVIMHSPAKWRHGESMGLIYMLLASHVNRHKLGKAAMEKILVTLTRNDYEPDVLFFGPEKAAQITPDQTKFPAPDFVAEVLSPSTEHRDRGVKKQDYAAHGVGEYWIVDPVEQHIEQHQLHGTHYHLVGTRRADETITSLVVPGFSMPVLAAFDADANVAELAAVLR